jgi:hypothetical protein
MATLATFFREASSRQTGTRRSSRATRAGEATESIHAQARAQADPFRLRALPNDGIYFYSKKIDNQRLVRQADPEARGECWSAVGAAGVLLMLGASIIAPHVGSILAGYKLESLKQERQTLIDQKRDLEVKEAGLVSPERLNGLARARSLTSPASDQVIHLDTGAGTVDASLVPSPVPSSAVAPSNGQ